MAAETDLREGTAATPDHPPIAPGYVPAAPTYGPTAPQEEEIRSTAEQVRDLVGGISGPLGLPTFDPRTLLPLPGAFDEPIKALELASRAFGQLGDPLVRQLAALDWRGGDADRFRETFASGRRSALRDRTADLERLAGTLRAIQLATKDERELLIAIGHRVVEFLDDVRRALQQALELAREKVETAGRAVAAAGEAVGESIDSLVHGVKALGEAAVPGGSDGTDELRKAAESAEDAANAAQRALNEIVDFVTQWPWRPATLPDGVCRQWYEVDEFMASKSGSSEAYGAVYRRPPGAPGATTFTRRMWSA